MAQLPLNTIFALGADGLASVSSVTTSLLTLESNFSEVSGKRDTADPLTGTGPNANAGPLAGSAHNTSLPLAGTACMTAFFVLVLAALWSSLREARLEAV